MFWNPQDLLLRMATEIFKIDASRAEKLTKTRVQFLLTPTVVPRPNNKSYLTMSPCCSSLLFLCILCRVALRIVLQCELWDCRNQISRWPQLSFCWLSCMRPIWCLLVLTTAGSQNTAQSGPRILIGKIGAAAGTWAPGPQTIQHCHRDIGPNTGYHHQITCHCILESMRNGS